MRCGSLAGAGNRPARRVGNQLLHAHLRDARHLRSASLRRHEDFLGAARPYAARHIAGHLAHHRIPEHQRNRCHQHVGMRRRPAHGIFTRRAAVRARLEWTENLDNYFDYSHHSGEISDAIIRAMAAGENRVTSVEEMNAGSAIIRASAQAFAGRYEGR